MDLFQFWNEVTPPTPEILAARYLDRKPRPVTLAPEEQERQLQSLPQADLTQVPADIRKDLEWIRAHHG
jgi:hypothetical protein